MMEISEWCADPGAVWCTHQTKEAAGQQPHAVRALLVQLYQARCAMEATACFCLMSLRLGRKNTARACRSGPPYPIH